MTDVVELRSRRDRDVLERLRRGESFNGEKLMGLDLSGQDLRDADFSGARFYDCCFDRADLRGARFRGVEMSDASFLNARLDGADLSRARARHASFTKASLRGVVLKDIRSSDVDFSRSDMTGANLSRARFFSRNVRFRGADLRGASFAAADCHDVDLSRTKLEGTDFTKASIRRCDLSGAVVVHESELTGRPGEGPYREDAAASDEHAPDLTAGARFLGCDYGADFHCPRTHRAMSWDNWPGRRHVFDPRTGRNKAYELAAEGVMGLAKYGVIATAGWLGYAGTESSLTGGVVAAATAGVAFKIAEKFVEDYVENGIDGAMTSLGSFLSHARESGVLSRGLRDFVISAVTGDAKETVERTISMAAREERKAGRWGFVWSCAKGNTTLIVSDRVTYARALREVGARLAGRATSREPVTVTRAAAVGRPKANEPLAMRFDGNGTRILLAGERPGERVVAFYGASGRIERATNVATGESYELSSSLVNKLGLPGMSQRFAEELLRDEGLSCPVYDPETRRVEAGRDGALLVYRNADGKLDNTIGPAVLRSDGESSWFADGKRTERLVPRGQQTRSSPIRMVS